MHQFRQEDIKVFAFAEEDQSLQSEVGLIVVRQGMRPHFILCEVEENKGYHAGKNIIPVCMKARDLFAPNMPLSAISWQYFNGYQSSGLNFTEVKGWPLFVSCEHELPFNDKYQIPSINDYPAILTNVLNATRPGPEISATSVILPMDAKNGYMSMKWEEPDLGVYPYSKLYLVDTYKFANNWLPEIERSDKELFRRFTRDGAQEHLIDSYADRSPFYYPLDMPHMTFFPEGQDQFRFVNGNHRTLNLIRAGVPFIPMHVSVSNEAGHQRFERQYGWNRGDNLTVLPTLAYSSFELA